MDAVEYIKERDRMCETYGNCSGCQACLDNQCIVARRSGFAPEQQVNTVKVWAEQHPYKTRQDVFLEQYPEAEIDLNGLLLVCPATIFRSHRNKGGGCSDFHKNCADCCREFWTQKAE